MRKKKSVPVVPAALPPNDGIRPSWPAWAAALLIAVLGLAAYAGALGGEFVYDDARLVQNNLYIKQWAHLGRIFTEDIGAGAGSIYNHYNFYRPLQMLSYMVDHTLWGREPFGYHLTSVLCHVAAALAFFVFACMVTGDRRAGFAAAALYVVHPVHVEAVAYIAGRADSLVAFFMLVCLIMYLKHLASGRTAAYLISLAAFVAACMSKEYALITPAFIALYHYAFRKAWRWRAFAPFLGILAAYLLLRATVFNFPVVGRPQHGALFERLPGMFIAYFEYIRLIVLPVGLHMEYGSSLFRLAEPRALAGAALLAGTAWLLARARRSSPVAFFSLGWFLVGLLPVSNLFPINAYLAEHWLYVPLMGVAILAGQGLAALGRGARLRAVAVAVFIAAVAYLAALTVRQNGYWKDSITFYETTLHFSPDNGRIYANLATEYLRLGRHEKAVEVYKTAIANMRDTAGAYNNLGITYASLGRNAEAVEAYRKAIEENPSFAEAYNNLGVSYAEMGDRAGAVEAFGRAIELNPGYADAYNNLGSELADPQAAIAAYERALAADPYHASACYNLGRAYEAAGRPADAERMRARSRALQAPGSRERMRL